MMKIFHLPIDGKGKVIELDLAPTDTPAYTNALSKKLYELTDSRGVGTEVVMLNKDLHMWCHEEGMYTKEPNRFATYVAVLYGFTTQMYHGDVVFTGGGDSDGTTLGLTDQDAKYLDGRFGPDVWQNL